MGSLDGTQAIAIAIPSSTRAEHIGAVQDIMAVRFADFTPQR